MDTKYRVCSQDLAAGETLDVVASLSSLPVSSGLFSMCPLRPVSQGCLGLLMGRVYHFQVRFMLSRYTVLPNFSFNPPPTPAPLPATFMDASLKVHEAAAAPDCRAERSRNACEKREDKCILLVTGRRNCLRAGGLSEGEFEVQCWVASSIRRQFSKCQGQPCESRDWDTFQPRRSLVRLFEPVAVKEVLTPVCVK